MPRSTPSSLAEKIGQLLIIGFEGTEMSPRLASLLARVAPAGVILFARNIKSAAQTWKLLRDCQRCVPAPLFKCVDLEGGTVDRLRAVLGPSPAPAEVFATGSPKLFRRHGEILGANARALGFNLDFAPVLDLALPPSQSVMGSRSVSPDPELATLYAREFLSGLRAAKVLGSGKHFPGLGEGSLDSHQATPVIEKPLENLWAEDLVPYRRLRRALDFVMISHAAYPAVTKDATPASLSRHWIADILRQRIGYGGLVVSDDLEMGGVLSAAPVGEAAVEFLRAGGDLCLVCHREDYVLAAHEALAKKIEGDPKFARRVAESLGRVAAHKKKWAKLLKLSSQAPSDAAVKKLARQLWEFGERVRLEPLARAEDRKRQERRSSKK